jgi:hypothetical protein
LCGRESKALGFRSAEASSTTWRARVWTWQREEKGVGATLIGTLRESNGPLFGVGQRSDKKLQTLLKETGAKSLSDYLRRHNK